MRSILIFLFFPYVMFAQDIENKKKCIYTFYKILHQDKVSIKEFSKIYDGATFNNDEELFREECKKSGIEPKVCQQKLEERNLHQDTAISMVHQKVKLYLNELTNGVPLLEIEKIIQSAEIFSEGLEFTVMAELKFPQYCVTFGLTSDTPDEITAIWLNGGVSLEGKVFNFKTNKLQRPGIINDPDGYVNIRKNPDKSSTVVGRFKKNEVFYYTPICGRDWWPVYKNEGGEQIGYVHKSKILKYTDFPQWLKEKVRKQRSGC